jgi:hypothetical protein
MECGEFEFVLLLATSHAGNLAIWPPDQFQKGFDLDQASLKE